MASFVRRFLFDPGIETLLEIESVNIIDLEPPAQITGVGAGTVLMVGEFENGTFVQREVTSASDFKSTFGSFGYENDGVPGNNPSARSRKADNVLTAEFFNGNGFVALANKKFKRLIVLRIDTSVGEVEFTRLPCLLGSDAPAFDLADAETLVVDDGGGNDTVTLDGVVATVLSAAGMFATGFTGGEKMNVTIDDGVVGQQIGPVDIVFQAGDQSQAQAIARINLVLGFTSASDTGMDTTTMVGRVQGTAGNVIINSIDAAVATALGFAAGTTNGTGNVANIDAVTVAELDSLIDTATAGNVKADRDADGKLRICNVNTSLTTLAIDVLSTATGFGFTIPSSTDATVEADNIDVIIPAGTRVRNSGAVEWVTMQDVATKANNRGPYSVKVRPGLDDGTVAGSVAASVAVLPFPIRGAGFAVTNPLPLTAALTEAQIDVKYTDAIITTKSLVKVGKEANIIAAARQSNIIRAGLRTNAVEASSEGALGRMAIIRPPLGTTTRAVATGSVAPGVGATRNQRVVYAFPGAQTFISQIAFQGSAGGAGFTDDGLIDSGADAFMASAMSQLPPEENPGQLTEFLNGVTGIEAGNPDVQDLAIGDYISFRKNGVAALRQSINTGQFLFQSGVTSVNPATNPNLRNIARRRMADFIQDTLALRATAFGKKLATRSRRAAVIAEFRQFMKSLVDDERLAAQSALQSGDSAEIKLGIFRLIIKGTTISSLDSIVLESTIGETVTIDEVA